VTNAGAGSVDRSFSRTTLDDWIIAKTAANGIITPTQDYIDVEVCELFDNEIVFPSTMPAVTNSSTPIVSSIEVRKLFAPVPNPAKSEVSLGVNIPLNENANLYISDVLGKREWASVPIQGTGNKQTLELNISNMPQGVYYLKVKSDTGWSGTQKMMIIK